MFAFCRLVFCFFILILFSIGCGRKVETGSITGDFQAAFMESGDERILTQLLINAMDAIENQNLEPVLAYVHPDMGLFVDLKSQRTIQQLETDMANPDSFLNVYFTNTEKLRAQTADPLQKSIRDVLRSSRHIKLHFLVDQPDLVEIDLELVDNPEDRFRLNNPAFTRQNGEWYLYRLF